jgi:hypothetical protein
VIGVVSLHGSICWYSGESAAWTQKPIPITYGQSQIVILAVFDVHSGRDFGGSFSFQVRLEFILVSSSNGTR